MLLKRISSLILISSLVCSMLAMSASATVGDAFNYAADIIAQWMNPSNTTPLGGWNIVDFGSALFQSNKEQNYYTTPTESVEDSKGNVVNYYRGGDTTNTKIIDSYNRTFNTIHNTTNNTNNYSANVKLSDFLNSYTTNNNNYSYSADLKTWYYDNDTNNYNYTSNQTYYNTDNSRYYISIDNSTDEYYLVDIQYSPTFVTVNYTYNTTNNSVTNNYGDVTNVYYYELDDGRNSYTLTVSEALGIASGFDVVNYELVPDDPDTLSLQHFDGNYDDSSAFGRSYYSANRSTTYVDSGDFGKAVKLFNGSSAGVMIPSLSSNSTLQIDFRAYYDDISSLSVYMGDTVIFGNIPTGQKQSGNYVSAPYSDDQEVVDFVSTSLSNFLNLDDVTYISSSWSSSRSLKPYSLVNVYSSDYGAYTNLFSSPVVTYSSIESKSLSVIDSEYNSSSKTYSGTARKYHSATAYVKTTFTGSSVVASANFSNYVNQWVSFRIVFSGGQLYYFLNGDLIGSGSFSIPSSENVYISSCGTVYLDELRVSTGSLVNTSVYSPASAPYDTNMILALPDILTANTIYVRHQTPVNGWRIGGVRPSAPATGFFYLPLHSDYTGAQPQLYDGSNWVDVDAVVSVDGNSVVSVIGYTFVPAGNASDVNQDLQPGRPDSGDGDSSSCSHSWEETSRVDASCSVSGSIEYSCSKCGLTKTEIISATGHSWVLVGTVQSEFDSEGNCIVKGYTSYSCSLCDTEYKDYDGSGPPSGNDDDDDKPSLWSKLINGLFGIIGDIFTSIFDGLLDLGLSALSKIKDVVNLFGSFGDSLSILWSWLPSEIVSVFVTGVTVVVFASVIKLFIK